MAQKTKEKESTTSQHLYLVCFVGTLETCLKFLCMSFLQTEKALFVCCECMYIRVCFSNCVYALLPEEQRLGVFPPRHL